VLLDVCVQDHRLLIVARTRASKGVNGLSGFPLLEDVDPSLVECIG
jgi:hypothetical protein